MNFFVKSHHSFLDYCVLTSFFHYDEFIRYRCRKKFVKWRKSRNECCNFTEKTWFCQGETNVNKNPVNLLCDLQHPQQTNLWDLGQISCNNMSSLMLIKGIKERLMMMDLVTQMDKAKECVNFALTHQAISKEDKE